MSRFLRLSCATVFLALAGCGADHGQVEEPAPALATWDVIQAKILTPRCANCHVEGSSEAIQSDLVLTPDVAYQQLVGAPPKNPQAIADGLVRVSRDGITGPFKSYLWEKINWPNEDHYLTDHPEYGNLMPVGGPPLTYGELRYIWSWMSRGAPRGGIVADQLDLRDDRVYQPGPFVGLDPPAQGFQFKFGPFDVPPGHDREIFEYRLVNFPPHSFVNRYQIRMRQGSHHFLLHTFAPDTPEQLIPQPGVVRDLYDENGDRVATTLYPMLYHEFFVGTQTPLADYTFPPGIAMELPEQDAVDLNSHYVNRGAETITGEVHLNLHTVPSSEVQHVARRMSLSNRALVLPPGEITTVEKTWTMGERRHVFLLVSHAHEHMTTFEVELVGGDRDGELVYFTNDWEHPPILQLDPPLTLEAGQGLKLRVTYDNWTDRTLGFGLLSEDEMMILFGYYYTD